MGAGSHLPAPAAPAPQAPQPNATAHPVRRQVRTQPPVPPLRLTALCILVSVPMLLLVHTLPTRLLKCWRRRRRARRLSCGGNGAAAAAEALAVVTEPEPKQLQTRQQQQGEEGAGGEDVHSDGGGSFAYDAADVDGDGDDDTGDGSGAGGAPEAVAGLPRVPTLPGLARLYRRHPRRHRAAVLLAVSVSYALVIVALNTAPLLVDPPVGARAAAAGAAARALGQPLQ
jgi:hypothetical protein